VADWCKPQLTLNRATLRVADRLVQHKIGVAIPSRLVAIDDHQLRPVISLHHGK
jgi:hypothetical protein